MSPFARQSQATAVQIWRKTRRGEHLDVPSVHVEAFFHCKSISHVVLELASTQLGLLNETESFRETP